MGISLLFSKPLLYLLTWVHSHLVHNWGWAIVVLTFILNFVLLPLRIGAMKSLAKMQRIQPQMEAIKGKYKEYKLSDPRRLDMQRELMDLQKKEGINPFGGCLPMLIQWPILFGFYYMLSHAVELRHAPWLWLADLSAPDPYHVLPILFILSMLLTQLLTPSPGMDRRQQRMMALMMPLIFGFMVWRYSSGLALYWTCSNLLSILLQMAMNRLVLEGELHKELRPNEGETI